MDERVVQALQQWPNVPDVYGWLALDRRGRWLLRGETISNPNLINFINRNYLRTEQSSYAFQNGPQKVHIALQATPWIAHIVEPQSQDRELADHTGQAITELKALWLDTEGDLILETERGPALLSDQDLWLASQWFCDAQGRELGDEMSDDEIIEKLATPEKNGLHWKISSGLVPLKQRPQASLEEQFGFISQMADPATHSDKS